MKKWHFFGNDAYIMELGQISLQEYFENKADELTYDRIRKMATEIALAMLDFHRGRIGAWT
jgi:hypothetical protein